MAPFKEGNIQPDVTKQEGSGEDFETLEKSPRKKWYEEQWSRDHLSIPEVGQKIEKQRKQFRSDEELTALGLWHTVPGRPQGWINRDQTGNPSEEEIKKLEERMDEVIAKAKKIQKERKLFSMFDLTSQNEEAFSPEDKKILELALMRERFLEDDKGATDLYKRMRGTHSNPEDFKEY